MFEIGVDLGRLLLGCEEFRAGVGIAHEACAGLLGRHEVVPNLGGERPCVTGDGFDRLIKQGIIAARGLDDVDHDLGGVAVGDELGVGVFSEPQRKISRDGTREGVVGGDLGLLNQGGVLEFCE